MGGLTPACEGRDPEDFFPDGRDALIRIRLAQAVCRECPLVMECLEIAMRAERATGASSRYGIFGGKTPEERAALARSRYRRRAKAAEGA